MISMSGNNREKGTKMNWLDWNHPDKDHGENFDVNVEIDGRSITLNQSLNDEAARRGISVRDFDDDGIWLLEMLRHEGCLSGDDNKRRIADAKIDSILYYNNGLVDKDYRTRYYAAIIGDCDVYLLINGDGSFDLVHLDANYDVDDVMTSEDIIRYGVKVPNASGTYDIRVSVLFHGTTLHYEHDTDTRQEQNHYTLVDPIGIWTANGPRHYKG